MEHQHQDQELKLTTIFKVGKEYFFHFVNLKRIALILFAGLLLGGILYFLETRKPLVYTASLKFMLADEGTEGVNPLSGMLGQFGLGGGAGGGANLKRMKALLTTQKIIKKTMFTTIEMDGKKDFLANHYIDKFKLHEMWAEREQDDLVGFYFKSSDFERFDRENHSISNHIYSQIAKNTLNGNLEKPHLSSEFNDEGTNIVDLKFTSTSENYSLVFLTTLYDILSDFYVSKSIAKQDENYKMSKKRVDSLKAILDKNQYQIANFKDTNRGIFKNQSRLKIEELENEAYRLKGLYSVAANNFEMSKIALQSKTPFITPIDMPLYPLATVRGTPTKRLKLGAPLGAAIMIFLLGAQKFIVDTLEKERLAEEKRLKEERLKEDRL